MKELKLNVQGMKCDGCAKSVDQKFREIPGVQDVEVSFQNSSATVKAEDNVSEEQLMDSLKGTTYKAIPEGEKA